MTQFENINNYIFKFNAYLPFSLFEICASSFKFGDINDNPFHKSDKNGFVATAMSVVSKYTVQQIKYHWR